MALRGGPSWEEVDDPARDGWATEELTEDISELWAHVTSALASDDASAVEVAATRIAHESLRTGALRPPLEPPSFRDGRLTVRRSSEADDAPPPRTGLAALGAELAALREPLERVTRVKIKIVGIERDAGAVATRQLFALAGATREGGHLEHHATWIARWILTPSGEPRLSGLRAESVEETSRQDPEALLVDSTASVLPASGALHQQLRHGFNHWLERLQDNRFFALLGTPGLAVGDVDGDGLDDLYLSQEGGLPNRLLLQGPDGALRDASEGSGIDWIDSSRAALLIDLDDDGHQDLVCATLGALVVASGDGRGRFSIRAVLPTSNDTMSLSAADFDLDGDLDIYVCAYKSDDLTQDAGVVSIGSTDEFVYHDANNAAPNILLRNDIDAESWRLTDVTAEVGLDAANRRYSFAAAWEDYDLDGDQDLYVANDFGRNALYRNDGEGSSRRFVELAGPAGLEDSASGMGITWADFDRDGLPDVHVSNMFSAAGSRVTTQSEFKPDAPARVRDRLRRFARGNSLFRNLGDGFFEDVSVDAGITMGRWAWSSNFVDLNNDGWEDLVVANGYITTDDTGDL